MASNGKIGLFQLIICFKTSATPLPSTALLPIYLKIYVYPGQLTTFPITIAQKKTIRYLIFLIIQSNIVWLGSIYYRR
jgi:hypothetical protein